MKGDRVRISPAYPLPVGWSRVGTVIADSEDCVGVKLDEVDTPVIVPKAYLGAIL